ncbi:hypothetical protein J5N97_005142 [Dioscorea zingiberensis]|uniref:Uncharacterized protein n=1 Tax=Dioscorea zingiberensis TaxID=325984 RepID=A0A9D5D803_9LILI|nr:hypothetical protein J5N97_005142 [Dioscorea zingiberensis]
MENSPLHDNQPNIRHLDLGDSNTCNTNSTKQKTNVNRFEEYNDTQADPILIYSNSDNEEVEDLDDEMAERLEREIEQEIEDMWNAQLEWEKRQERGKESTVPIHSDQAMEGPTDESGKGNEHTIEEEPSDKPEPQEEPQKDADQPVEDRPDKHMPHEEPNAGFDQTSGPPLDESGGANLIITHGEKTPVPTEEQPERRSPNTQPTLKGKDSNIPGPDPDMDLSNHTWRSYRGSWILISDEAWEKLTAGVDPAVQAAQEHGRPEEPHTKGNKGKQKKTNPNPPKDGIRRSGRLRKPLAERLEKEGY